MSGLLYPAYQKYYSAICNLRRFSIENNFFDNISSLDNFFSEYRSVTLVMQKSLAHTEYIEAYNRISKGIWDKFFNDQRVKAVHMHSVEFSKTMDVTVYFPNADLPVSSQTFTVENDIPLSSLIDSMRTHLKSINPVEVFFSARFSFVEKDSGADLWEKIVPGLDTMRKFMDEMYCEIGEICPLCEQLRKEISSAEISEAIKDILLVADYAYYPQKDRFERAQRLAMYFKADNVMGHNRNSVDSFLSFPYFRYGDSAFDKFVFMNVIICSVDLMPTIMIVYHDGTYEMDTFHASIKTTIYRKINETAEKILNDNVKEVFMMLTYVVVKYEYDLMTATSKERLGKGTKEYLTFLKVDYELNEEECVFDGDCIDQEGYIVEQLENGKRNKLDAGVVNMMPIIKAFKTRKEMQEKENEGL